MIRSVAILVLVGIATAATLTKKEGYGGSGYSPSAPSSYGTSGSSYHDGGSSYSGGGGNDASYGGSGGASYGGGGGGAGSYGQDSSSGSSSSGDSYGNLYYYYYPVTPNNHSSAPSHYGGGGSNYGGGGNNYGQQGGGGGGGYGPQGGGNYGSMGPYGGGGNYYPPSYNDPFGGLLSIISSVDINSLILPALLIGGVALLLPAILNCDLSLGTCIIPLPFSTGAQRGGRDLDDFSYQQMTIPQMVDHAYRIYDAVHESDICMQRVVCELGGMLRNVRGKDAFFSVLEQFASPSVKKQLLVLKQGALPPMDSPPSCIKYICGKIDNKI